MKKIIKLCVVVVFVLNSVCIVNSAENLVVDISKLAGKTEKQVSKYLGTPELCEKSKYGKKCQYKKGETEIVFIQGKADWITINNIGDIPFSERALEAIGIKTNKPSTYYKNGVIRWDNTIKGFEEVSIFKNSESSVWYYYIKVKTK